MSEPERDPYTGLMTTGHEWNGIKELKTPIPRTVKFFLLLTILFSILLWVLFPTWPYGPGYTKGVLGVDQRKSVEADLKASALLRADWEKKFSGTELAALEADDGAMSFVREHGRRLFEDNCGVCHGVDGKGGPGFPNLADDQWLWGGDTEAIMETLRVGINSSHEDTRNAEMLAFGDQDLLDLNQRRAVTAYIISLSRPGDTGSDSQDLLTEGVQVFVENCASCHGENGEGNRDLGAPNLADKYWIYGGSADTIMATLRHGRKGVMPHWDGRLSEADRRVLTLYVRDLGAKDQ